MRVCNMAGSHRFYKSKSQPAHPHLVFLRSGGGGGIGVILCCVACDLMMTVAATAQMPYFIFDLSLAYVFRIPQIQPYIYVYFVSNENGKYLFEYGYHRICCSSVCVCVCAHFTCIYCIRTAISFDAHIKLFAYIFALHMIRFDGCCLVAPIFFICFLSAIIMKEMFSLLHERSLFLFSRMAFFIS